MDTTYTPQFVNNVKYPIRYFAKTQLVYSYINNKNKVISSSMCYENKQGG